MPLVGRAAMLLSFDVAPEAIPEHDAWHTHEHLPERLSIPGFLRGSRWVAVRGGPRYFVMYEVESLDTLTSKAYLDRLNAPSAWTARMMPHYRGMTRGYCSVSGSVGAGLGQLALVLRFTPAAGAESSLRRWLLDVALPPLPSTRGVGSAHLLESAATPGMTREQRLRGADAGAGWALLVTGYDEAALARLASSDVGAAQLQAHGAANVVEATYRLHYTLVHRELDPRPARR
ncbi:MAG TPA: hypothetical protein VFQ55_08545 [Casimicrobiaceae bacterium]|nr:hypothetical protein [Casimicrobiaceae bacterium]